MKEANDLRTEYALGKTQSDNTLDVNRAIFEMVERYRMIAADVLYSYLINAFEGVGNSKLAASAVHKLVKARRVFLSSDEKYVMAQPWMTPTSDNLVMSRAIRVAIAFMLFGDDTFFRTNVMDSNMPDKLLTVSFVHRNEDGTETPRIVHIMHIITGTELPFTAAIAEKPVSREALGYYTRIAIVDDGFCDYKCKKSRH